MEFSATGVISGGLKFVTDLFHTVTGMCHDGYFKVFNWLYGWIAAHTTIMTHAVMILLIAIILFVPFKKLFGNVISFKGGKLNINRNNLFNLILLILGAMVVLVIISGIVVSVF